VKLLLVDFSVPLNNASQYMCLCVCLQLRQVPLELKMTCGPILSSLASLKYVQIFLCIFLLFSFLLKSSAHSLCQFGSMIWFIAQGSTPRKVVWGFPKPLPYLWPKSVIFPTLFMTWPNIQYPVYHHCGWHNCPKHNLWRAFVDGLINNDEKVLSTLSFF